MTGDDNKISDSVSLTESLLQQAGENRSPSSPGVYALEIDTPNAGHETHARLWLEHYDSTPPYLSSIVECDKCVYVGAAKSVRDRLDDHLAGDVRTATLPTVYEIETLDGVWWYDSADAAFALEQQICDHINAEHPDWFAHSR